MARSEAVLGLDLVVVRTTRDVRGTIKRAREAGALSSEKVRFLVISDGDLLDLERTCRVLAALVRDHRGEVRVLVRKLDLRAALTELLTQEPIETVWVAAEDVAVAESVGISDVRGGDASGLAMNLQSSKRSV